MLPSGSVTVVVISRASQNWQAPFNISYILRRYPVSFVYR